MQDLHARLLEAAVAWHQQGAFICPPMNDGSKAPSIKQWRSLGHHDRGTLEEIIDIWGNEDWDGIGLFTGSRSINIECTEFEGRAIDDGLMHTLEQLAADNDMQEIIDKLMTGYIERSPSRGVHFIYRVEGDNGVRANTVLARNSGNEVLAESRGEGGYIVLAPSGGRVHDLGPYETLFDRIPEDMVTFTIEERDKLWALIQMLDEAPESTYSAAPTDPLPGGATPGKRPGDDFNEKATWEDILTPHGWTRGYAMGSGYAWKKPNKTKPGISATTGQSRDGIDRLYVFSTSTVFEAGRPYNKFSAYALLNHSGDFKEAARELGRQGYGEQATITPTLPTINPTPAAAPAPAAPAPAPAAATQTQTTTTLPPAAPSLFDSEDGAAIALVNDYGRDIRYCPEMGKWLFWTGNVWEIQPKGGMVAEIIRGLGRTLPETSTAEIRHKRRVLSAAGNNAILTLASTDPVIVVHVDDLDQRTMELNTPAGIINLRDGTLGPPNPASLHTKITAAAPDPNGDLGPWLTFLNETFAGEHRHELITFVQRLLGYALIGEVRDSILPVFYGSGANGKTVLLETVSDIIGDYATAVGQKFLVQGPDRHSTEIAKLSGRRLVVASETNEGERFDEAKVKLLTGGDKLTARFMRQDEFTFTPTHTLIQLTNHKPDVQGGGHGFWRRLRLVPFDNTVPDDRIDTGLKRRLVEDHGGAILWWLAQGAAQYLQDGLGSPEAVLAATSEYAQESDSIARFLADTELIERGPGKRDRTKFVLDTYREWCEAEGIEPWNQTKFGKAMETAGIRKIRSNGIRFYDGIEINQTTLREMRNISRNDETEGNSP